jgi:hypothetical protein
MAGNCHGALLRRMLQLPVTTPLTNHSPAILPQEPQYLPHRHQYTPTVVVAAKPR